MSFWVQGPIHIFELLCRTRPTRSLCVIPDAALESVSARTFAYSPVAWGVLQVKNDRAGLFTISCNSASAEWLFSKSWHKNTSPPLVDRRAEALCPVAVHLNVDLVWHILTLGIPPHIWLSVEMGSWSHHMHLMRFQRCFRCSHADWRGVLKVWSVGCRAVCHQCGRPVSVTSYFMKLLEGPVYHCQSASKRCLRCFPFVEKEVGHYLGTLWVVRLRLKVVLSPAHCSFRGPPLRPLDCQFSASATTRRVVPMRHRGIWAIAIRQMPRQHHTHVMPRVWIFGLPLVSPWAPSRSTCSWNSGPAPLVPHGTFRSCNTQLRVLFVLREDNPKCPYQTTREKKKKKKKASETSCKLHSLLRLPHGGCKTENQPHTSAKESVRDTHAICTSIVLGLVQIECRRVASCPPSTAFGQTFPQLGLSVLSCTPDWWRFSVSFSQNSCTSCRSRSSPLSLFSSCLSRKEGSQCTAIKTIEKRNCFGPNNVNRSSRNGSCVEGISLSCGTRRWSNKDREEARAEARMAFHRRIHAATSPTLHDLRNRRARSSQGGDELGGLRPSPFSAGYPHPLTTHVICSFWWIRTSAVLPLWYFSLFGASNFLVVFSPWILAILGTPSLSTFTMSRTKEMRRGRAKGELAGSEERSTLGNSGVVRVSLVNVRFLVLGFQSSRVLGFWCSRIPRFQGSRVPGFEGSSVPGF